MPPGPKAPLTADRSPGFSAERALALAAQTFEIEARALQALSARQGEGFVRAVQAMLACRGRTIVMGIGKSGHVGRKIAATLASTGTPSFFVHPAEASHGDLGMVTPGDVVLAISNSGEVDELVALLPALRRLSVTLVAMTGKPMSSLAQHADIVLSSAVDQEACPLNLAPTASTTAQMALGDALAVALLDARGFVAEDFARSHPGGSLGRRLLTHVRDLMRQGDAVPAVGPTASMSAMLREMSAKGLGFTAVASDDGQVLGIFTDGDLRRLVHAGDLTALDRPVSDRMTRQPQRLTVDQLVRDAVALVRERRLDEIPVVDGDGRPVGLIDVQDLIAMKVVRD